MADLSVNFCGIKSPNPSGSPPLLRQTRPIISSAPSAPDGAASFGRPLARKGRRSSMSQGRVWCRARNGPARHRVQQHRAHHRQAAGDQPSGNHGDEAPLADRAIVVSLMVPCEEEAWKRILPRVEATGADGIELNFGCPHGMSERGMGAAVGQVPEYVEMVTRWCKTHSRMPVIVKLTPNISDVRKPAEAQSAAERMRSPSSTRSTPSSASISIA